MTLYLVPKGKSDTDEDVKKVEIGDFNRIGDSNPEKVEEIGEYTLKVKDPTDDAVLTSKDVTLKLGASYEFLVQWNDREGENHLSSSQLITVGVRTLDVNILLLVYQYKRRTNHTICYLNFQNTTAFETIAQENNVQILWLLPQFIIMTAGEIMFSITTMQFSFTQVITMILINVKFISK